MRTLRAVVGSQDHMFPLETVTIEIRQCKVYSRFKNCTSNDPKGILRFQHFTGLRLGKVQKPEDPKEFFWVPGELNIADLISRGSSPAELELVSKWQSSPSF